MVLASWTAHPVRRRPRDIALVAAVVLTTTGAVLTGLGSPLLAVLAPIVLLASVASFLLPTRYVISDWGVEERRVGRHRARAWSEIRRVEVGPGAALLSPLPRQSWLDRYRGLIVLFDGGDRDRIVALLEEHAP